MWILAQSTSSPADDSVQEEREIKANVSAHLSHSGWATPKLPVPPSVWAARLSPIMKYSQVTAFLRNDGDQSIAFQLVIFSPFTAPLTMLTVISTGRRLDRTTNAALSTERSQRLVCLSPFSSLPLPSSPLSSPLISTGILSWSASQTLFPLTCLSYLLICFVLSQLLLPYHTDFHTPHYKALWSGSHEGSMSVLTCVNWSYPCSLLWLNCRLLFLSFLFFFLIQHNYRFSTRWKR